MAIPDVKMLRQRAYAPKGILDLGKFADTGCISTLKKVPTTGYLDSVDLSYLQLGHLFVIKTSEMNYALLYYRFSGSGVPFNEFRWAYQPDGTPEFGGAQTLTSEVRSGFWSQSYQSQMRFAVSADFSGLLNPFCITEGATYQCTYSTGDFTFPFFDSISAPKGIFYDSSVNALIQSRFVSGKTITMDREGLFYMDSMMKQIGLRAPVGVFKTSVPDRKGVYFIKTSEDRIATLIKIGGYIGGIDRTHYYWAYQPDTGTALFKSTLYEPPDSLTIIPSVFSGREDPVFRLTDPAGISAITRQIYLSVNTLLDSSIKRTQAMQCPTRSGYRKLTVIGMFQPDVQNNNYLPSVDICGGLIEYYKFSPMYSVIPPRLLYDVNSRLERLIIKVCCELNLSATDRYGTIRFCDVIPDSLKPGVFVSAGFQRQQTNSPIVIVPEGTQGIRYMVNEAGPVRIDLFNPAGRCMCRVANGFRERGTYTIDNREVKYGAGVYFVKFSRPGLKAGGSFFRAIMIGQ